MSDFTGGMSSVYSAKASRDANDAATKQAAYQQMSSLKSQEKIAGQQRADQAPYMQIGALGAQQYKDYLNGTYNPINNAGYEYQVGETQKNLGRSLRALGRENSTYGMNTMGKTLSGLAATNEQNSYDRMLDPLRVGQGAASTAGQLGSAMLGAYGNYGTNMGNLSLARGVNESQYIQGVGNSNQKFNNGILSTYSSLYGGGKGMGG